MTRKKQPMISVVICTYNGAAVLGACLDAIKKQSWRKREIIVVDDGSTDDTVRVAKKHRVKVIANTQNLGPAAARNVGIKAAKGDIVAFTDDDCRPRPSWLRELAAVYESEDAVAVGGTVAPHATDKLLFRYLRENNPMAPLEANIAAPRSFFGRLKGYIKSVVSPVKQTRKRRIYATAGANVSFTRKALDAVKGFDEAYSFSGEDQDLCRRVQTQFPDRTWFAPKAKVLHEFNPQLKDTLRRSMAYGKGSVAFARKHNGVKPVIFPFPLAATLSLLLGLLHPLLLLTPLILPLIMYPRWAKLAFARRSPEPFVYAYIQFLQECFGNAGCIRALFTRQPAGNRNAAGGKGMVGGRLWGIPTGRNAVSTEGEASLTEPAGIEAPKRLGTLTLQKRAVFGLVLLAAAAMNVLVFVHNPLTAILVLAGLCTIPGALLLTALQVPVRSLSGVVWTIATSVAMLLGVALGANGIAILTHGSITTGLLLGMFDLLSAGLFVVAWLRGPQKVVITLYVRTLWRVALAVAMMLLPLAAIAGSNLLNNRNVNMLSMSVLGAFLAVAFIVGVYLKRIQAKFLVPYILYVLSVAMIWMGAARGDFVSGTDISKEFYLFTLTQHTGHWSPSLYHDPYNSCLSINLLPLLIGKLTHWSNETIFRYVLPSIYALLPVMVYAICRGRAKKLTAYLAAVFFMAQPVFMTWSSIPIRQMMGFVFFAAMLMVLFDKALVRLPRAILFTMLAFAMVLAHYSTTYIAIGVLVIAYMLQLIEFIATKRHLPWDREDFRPIVAMPGIIILIGFAALWYGPITHTSTNITHLFSNGINEIRHGQINVFSSDAHSQQTGLLDQFNITSRPRNTQQVWQEYLSKTDQKYAGIVVHPMQDKAQTANIEPLPSPVLPTHIGGVLGKLISLGGQVISKLTRLFLAVGLVLYVVKAKLRKSRDDCGFHLAAIASAVIIVLIIVVPYASIEYDLARTSQQLLPLLALPTITGAMWLCKLVTRNKLQRGKAGLVVGAVIGCYFLFMSGFVGQITGGVAPLALLNNSGNQYQTYAHTGEVMAAEWLSQTSDGKSLIYAGYFSGNRLWLANIDKPGFYNDILPWTIDKHAYVFADYSETANNVATTYYRGSFINYPYPAKVLNAKKDVLYANGQATIYK